MAIGPRTTEEIYTELRNRITDPEQFPGTAIKRLTNFVSGSFNEVWVRAFSRGLREREIQLTASQLSGWIDYAGGPVTEEDLDKLNINSVDPDTINQYMEDEDLEELVSLLDVSRDEGSRATATVRLSSSENRDVEIPQGTQVGTQPDSRGSFLTFFTTEQVTISENPSNNGEGTNPDGSTYVEVEVQAEEIGDRYNLPANTITYIPSPPPGLDGVNNPDEVSGGIDRESNDSLRERAKEAVFASTGGGTTSGIIGFIQQNTAARDVVIEEFTDVCPPYANVIVDGGSDEEVQDALDESRPVAIKHNLLRPRNFATNVSIEVVGEDTDIDEVIESIDEYLDLLKLGDAVRRDKIKQVSLNADSAIETTKNLIVSIIGDTYEFEEGTNVYEIRKPILNLLEVRGLVNSTETTFEEGVDFELSNNEIDWSIGDTEFINLSANDSVDIDLSIDSDVWYVNEVTGTDRENVIDEQNDDTTITVNDTEYIANPTLYLVQDVDYTFSDLPHTDHPLEFRDGTTILLSQDVEGSLESDSDIDWTDTDTTVSFTAAETLIDVVDNYISANDDTIGSDITAIAEDSPLLLDGNIPDDESNFLVDYDVDGDILMELKEKAIPNEITASIFEEED